MAKKKKQSFIVDKVEDHEDGSCTIHVDMDMETLKTFAAIGLKKVLLDEAERVMKENA